VVKGQVVVAARILAALSRRLAWINGRADTLSWTNRILHTGSV